MAAVDLDLVVEGDPAEIGRRLGGEVVEHERFATAKAQLGGHEVDIARARSETYERPGALPEVSPAGIEEDLARRDFTINAMAIPLGPDGPGRLTRSARGAGRSRAPGCCGCSIPGASATTRRGRCGRRATPPASGSSSRPDTAERLAETDLGTVSGERREAELLRIAAERTAPQAFGLLSRWGLVELRPGGAELAARVLDLLDSPPWSDIERPERTVLAAALGPPGGEEALAATAFERPSAAAAAARGKDPGELHPRPRHGRRVAGRIP